MATAAVHLPNARGSLPAEKPKIPVDEVLHNVQTELTFNLENEDGSPQAPIHIGKPETYFRPTINVPATIHDVSGHELEYNLDSHGFQYHYHESKLKDKDFLNEEEIKDVYYPETEQLLKDVTGCSRLHIFDHTIRRAARDWETGDQPRGPIQTVHIDASYQGAEDRVLFHFPDEAPELLKSRYQMISIWRPIRTILKDPLAVADSHSFPESCLVPITFVFPERVSGAWNVSPHPNMKWYFRYKQTPDMVTLIKLFDSKLDGRARRVPHAAFVDPSTAQEAPRESIELRALLFHPEDRS